MAFELTSKTYVERVWFIEGTDPDRECGVNWLCIFHKENNEGPWMITYRWRYFLDTKAFDSKDERHWYAMKARNGSEEMRVKSLETMKIMTNMMRSRYGSSITCDDEIDIQGDQLTFMEIMSRYSWFHGRTEKLPISDGTPS